MWVWLYLLKWTLSLVWMNPIKNVWIIWVMTLMMVLVAVVVMMVMVMSMRRRRRRRRKGCIWPPAVILVIYFALFLPSPSSCGKKSSLSPSANLIRSALSKLYPSACASDTERGSERQGAGEWREAYVLPFSFSVDVQREVLYRDWIREMNTIESQDSRAPKLKEKLKSRGTATCRIWSERMSWFVTHFIILSWDWALFLLTPPCNDDDLWRATSSQEETDLYSCVLWLIRFLYLPDFKSTLLLTI